MIAKPQEGEYNPFYETYIGKVPEGTDLLKMLETQANELPAWFESLNDQSDHRYAEGKWSIAEVLLHMLDAERIFAYRALCIARGETQALPGMDQNIYMNGALAHERSYESLIAELRAVRAATLTLAEGLSESVNTNVGNASGSPVSVRALFGIIAGHTAHHVQIIKERYL